MNPQKINEDNWDDDDDYQMTDEEWKLEEEAILDSMYPDRHDDDFDIDATSGDFDFHFD